MSASPGPRSQASPSPAEIETIAASYVRNHVLFADCSPDSEYDSMPAVPGAQAAADALIANLFFFGKHIDRSIENTLNGKRPRLVHHD
jgi:hypothetical protein